MAKNRTNSELVKTLIEDYEVKTIKDVHTALKDLFADTIKEMLELEMDQHLGYEKNERTKNSNNSRNGSSPKTIKSTLGEIEIDIPRDRNGEFEPEIIPKHKRDVSDIEDKIISMYARGISTREINEQINEIYGFKLSAEQVSKITDKILPEISEWQRRKLDEVYPIVFIDAIHFSVRDSGIVSKKAVYVVLAITTEGMKEVLGLYVGENESSKYWLGVLNDLKNRNLKDILILCSDGLTGLKESIEAAYPKTEHQRCIVHQIRNTLKYVSHKDKREFAKDLKKIYTSENEVRGTEMLMEVMEKWEKKYPNAMTSWENNWDVISPFFKYSKELRKIMYTTNAIESLNSGYRRLNKTRSVFPTPQSLLKCMYLATKKITKKWVSKYSDWGVMLGQLEIMFENRIKI